MLKLTYPDTFPIAYADWDLPLDYLSTTGKRNDIEIPLPPPGLSIETDGTTDVDLKRNGYYSTLCKGDGFNNQYLEHRNWLEKNKMAVKFIIDGPKGKRINTKKRVRLILGFFGGHVPALFYELRREAQRKDRYLRIDFVKFDRDPRGKLTITQFEK